MSDYNWEMTGPPDAITIATNPGAVADWNKFVGEATDGQGVSPNIPQRIDNPVYEDPTYWASGNVAYQTGGGETAYAPSFLRPQEYLSNALAAPYSTQEINAAVNPSNIRYGYNNTPYASVRGASDLSGGEYVVNPQTGKFVLDASGNPIPVPQEPYKQGTFDNIMTSYVIPGMLAAGAIGTGLGAAGLIGEGAALTAGELMGPTYGELGYTGLEAGMMGPTYAELGYTGLNGAEAIAASDLAAAQAAAASAGMTGLTASSLASLASALKAGGTISSLFGGKSTSTTGSNPNLANMVRQATGGYAQSAPGGLFKSNVNPYTFAKETPIQNKQTTNYDPFAALNVAQTPVTNTPNILADMLRKSEG